MSNVKALQIFQILRQGSVILTGILLAKSVLTIDDIGIYEMLFYIGTTLSFFWINGLLQGTLPIFPRLNEIDKKAFLFNAYLVFLGITILLGAILFLGQGMLTKILVGKTEISYYNLYCLFLILNLPSYLVEYIYLLINRPKSMVSFGGIVFGAYVAVILCPIFLGYDFEYSFYGLVILGFLKHLWMLLLLAKHSLFVFRIDLIKSYFNLSLPLILYALIAGFALIFDQWLVGWFYNGDETTFAIFRYGARELPLAMALTGAFSAAMIPEIAKKGNEQLALASLKRKSKKLLHLLFPLSIVLMLTSQYLFPIVFNDIFQPGAAIFNVYLLVLISRILFPHTVLIALKETTVILRFSIIELFINVILSFILVHYFGLEGIAFATVLAFLFEKVALSIYLYKKHKISLFTYTAVRLYGGYTLLLVVAYALSRII